VGPECTSSPTTATRCAQGADRWPCQFSQQHGDAGAQCCDPTSVASPHVPASNGEGEGVQPSPTSYSLIEGIP